MENGRTKKATKNIIFGTLLNFYKILMKFIMRTCLIHFLGVEYLGLDSLFVSILKVLSLAELGVGSALTFSMYKPVADKDEKMICSLMNLYKQYYRIIGLIVLIIGIVLCPFIGNFIKSDIPNGINIYVIYLINLLATVFSYWLFAYKNSILVAHQRNDIISKITISVLSFQYILQIIVLYIFKSFYIYIILTLFFQIILNIAIAMISNKMYPNYRPYGDIDADTKKSINLKVRDLFTSKVGAIVLNSADSIVISSFLGLTVLAVYENYYYVITAVMAVINVIYASCTAGIGNSLITETIDKNYEDFKKFSFILLWLITICTSCIICSIQNFINVWVGPDLSLDFSMVILFGVYFYVYQLITIFTTYKDAAGIWHKDRFRALAASITNLVLNIILVNYIGLYGIILSTIISLLIVAIPWLLYNIFTELFINKAKNYLQSFIKYILVSVAIIIFDYFLVFSIDFGDIYSFIIKNIICLFVSNTIWILFFRNDTIFKNTIDTFKRVVRGVIR